MSEIHRLRSITISNFRSIGGLVTVPLDAPVVLLHGLNGAGKTSVLSALELALSGSIDSMRRADPQYLQHLVHRGSETAMVSLDVSRVDGSTGTWQMSSDERGWGSEHFLEPDEADFYQERSYLAQATLGRLLEIYGTSEPSQGSALTRFVNDVLGLDSLESLIKGLSPAKDLRNTKNLVPEIAELERETKSLGDDTEQNARRVKDLSAELRTLAEQSRDELLALAELMGVSKVSLEELLSERSAESDESSLVALAGLRREIDSMLQRLQRAEETTAGTDLIALELRASEASQRSDNWQQENGATIERILLDIFKEFPDLPSMAEVGPSNSVDASMERVQGEFQRASDSLALDDQLRSRNDQLTKQIEAANARRSIINEQLADQVSGTGEIARLLSELIPHLHGNDCVVCGRDYSEVSNEPLSANAARRAASFTAQASRVSELSEARAAVVSELSEAEDDLRSSSGRLLSSSARSLLISKRAQFREWADLLVAHRDTALQGDEVLRESNEARRLLVTVRESAEVWVELREAISSVIETLGLPLPDGAAPLRGEFERASEEVAVRIRRLEGSVLSRRRLTEIERAKDAAVAELASATKLRDDLAGLSKSYARKRAGIDQARDQAKKYLQAAIDTQGSIVRKVFNESLNSLWRDLFVRLAPNEPFVPAFHVAHGSRDTKPQLVTIHRHGGEGGSPGSMLSSGNLNTAALTLFLALHLSSGDRLPLLVLDDPVQSMDDVHISQFAALLRTLSKQHGRQTLVAVHERALFDYLTLELSPAFEGDSLITVELKKNSDGSTAAEPEYHQWREDPVRAKPRLSGSA